MPLYNKDNRKCLFIHIPKCAGTTISEILKDETSSYSLYNPINCVDLPCTPQHYHAPLLRTIVDDVNIDSFTIVRNPLQRIISEYRWRIEISNDRSSIDIDSFVNKCLESYGYNSYIFDNHIRPQFHFLLSNTNVFFLEEGIAKAIAFIENLFDFCIDKKGIKRNVTTKDDLEISGNTIHRVHEFYEKDYEIFGYVRGEFNSNKIYKIDETSEDFIGTNDDIYCVKEVANCQNRYFMNESFRTYLPDKDIDLLRDSAVILENVNLYKAYELMSLAQIFRPSGKYIRQKLEKYRKEIRD